MKWEVMTNVSIMATDHLKTEVQPTPETLCRPISAIHQTMENVGHNVSIIIIIQDVLSVLKYKCFLARFSGQRLL